MKMKGWSSAACVWLLMLVLVAMAPNDAAYIDTANNEAIGDIDNRMYSQEDDTQVGAPSLADERRYEYKKLMMRAINDLAEQIRSRHPASAQDQYDERVAKKRGRWQGFCFRRTRSGRILPYICWKGSNF